MNGIHVAATGTLGADGELKFTASGTPMLTFSLAVTRNRQHGDGSETQWLRCTCWNDVAEALADKLKRGGEVYIEGSITLNEWTGQDGEKRSGLNASCWKVEPLGLIGKRGYDRSRAAKVGDAGGSVVQERPATEPQIKAIYAIGRGVRALDDAELDAYCRERYGCEPAHLSRQQASEFIDTLKLAEATA